MGLYCANLGRGNCVSSITLYPWIQVQSDSTRLSNVAKINSENTSLFNTTLEVKSSWDGLSVSQADIGIIINFSPLNLGTPADDSTQAVCEAITDVFSCADEHQLDLSRQLISVLGESVQKRVTSQSFLCHNCLKIQLNKPPSANRDVVEDNTIPHDFTSQLPPTHTLSNYAPSTSDQSENICHRTETQPRMLRRTNVSLAQECCTPCGHTRVAILYSGGIDSLVIAALADRLI